MVFSHSLPPNLSVSSMALGSLATARVEAEEEAAEEKEEEKEAEKEEEEKDPRMSTGIPTAGSLRRLQYL